MQDRGFKLEAASPDIVRYSKYLHCPIFCGHDEFVIQFIPHDLDGLSLHLNRTHFSQPQQVDHLDAGVRAAPITASHQLSTVTVDDLRAPLHEEFREELELCQQNLVYSDAVFEGEDEGVAVGVDG
jgi:hypothetical protein